MKEKKVDLSSMTISELVTFVKDGTDLNIEAGWKWEKIAGGNECKTLIVRYNNKTSYWQGHKWKDPYKLKEAIYKQISA